MGMHPCLVLAAGLVLCGPFAAHASSVSSAKGVAKTVVFPPFGESNAPAVPAVRPVLCGNVGVFKTYPMPAGNAQVVAQNLQRVYQGISDIRIAAVGRNQILVYAGPQDQVEIARKILP